MVISMQSEFIEIFWNQGVENVDWIRRIPRIISNKSISDVCDNSSLQKNSLNGTSQKNDSLLNFIKEVEQKIKKDKNSSSEYELAQIKQDLIKLCSNRYSFGESKEILSCIDNLNNYFLYKKNLISKSRNQYKNIRCDRNVIQQKLDRGVQIYERLKEINAIIKQIEEKSECNLMKNELLALKDELINKVSIFSEIDNIPSMIFQIDDYINAIEQRKKSCISTTKKTLVTAKIIPNGHTKRGCEIQKELENLQKETKRKDLNPIEKENLRNILLKLQMEILSDPDKFSKSDAIQGRLGQIENYLNRLKEKDIQRTKQVENSELIDEKNKVSELAKKKSKKKMKVIYRYGL